MGPLEGISENLTQGPLWQLRDVNRVLVARLGYLHFILTYPSLNKGGRMHEYELFAAYPHFIQGYLHFAITLSFGI